MSTQNRPYISTDWFQHTFNWNLLLFVHKLYFSITTDILVFPFLIWIVLFLIYFSSVHGSVKQNERNSIPYFCPISSRCFRLSSVYFSLLFTILWNKIEFLLNILVPNDILRLLLNILLFHTTPLWENVFFQFTKYRIVSRGTNSCTYDFLYFWYLKQLRCMRIQFQWFDWNL